MIFNLFMRLGCYIFGHHYSHVVEDLHTRKTFKSCCLCGRLSPISRPVFDGLVANNIARFDN